MTKWEEKSDASAGTLIEGLQAKAQQLAELIKTLKSIPADKLELLMEKHKDEITIAIETYDSRKIRFLIQQDRYLRLKTLKFRDLRKLAADLAVKYYNKLNTDELIAAIQEKERQLYETEY